VTDQPGLDPLDAPRSKKAVLDDPFDNGIASNQISPSLLGF